MYSDSVDPFVFCFMALSCFKWLTSNDYDPDKNSICECGVLMCCIFLINYSSVYIPWHSKYCQAVQILRPKCLPKTIDLSRLTQQGLGTTCQMTLSSVPMWTVLNQD